MGSSGYPSSSPLQGGFPKACIFDIDNTLSVRDDKMCQDPIRLSHPPMWPSDGKSTQTVIDILRKCDAHGYHLEIATAKDRRSHEKVQEVFLKELGERSGLSNSNVGSEQ